MGTSIVHRRPKPPLLERIAIRRRRGDSKEDIGSYAYAISSEVDDDQLRQLLTMDEFIEYERAKARAQVAAEAKRERLRMADYEAETSRKLRETRNELMQPLHDAMAREMDKLRKAGAMSRLQAAKKIGVTPYQIEKLRRNGALPSDGFIPVQFSRGKPCHVWTRDTVDRYIKSHMIE